MKRIILFALVWGFMMNTCLMAQNNCLDFDGINDQVSIPNSAALDIGTNAVTLECWVYLRELPADIVDDFASIYDSSQDAYIFYLDKSNNELRFKVTDSDDDAERPGIGAASLTTNTWIHIAGVYDASINSAKIYLNGTLADEHTNVDLDNLVKPGQAPFMGDQSGDGRLFDGKIDELRVWDKALTAGEISAQMSCELTGTESNLVSYYSFNQGTANGANGGVTTLTDDAGGSNGTLTGFSLSGTTSNWVNGQSSINPCSLLPVEISIFTANATPQGNQLKWETASEINNKGFEVQFSTDGRQWTNVDFITGAINSNNTRNHYSYLHTNAFQSTSYYRLKQIDLDGTIDYSDIVSVTRALSDSNIQLYPNPATDLLFLKGAKEGGTIKIINTQGQCIYSSKYLPHDNSINIQHLQKGYYQIIYQNSVGQNMASPFVKN